MFKNDETLSSFSMSRNSKKKSFFKSKYGKILIFLFLAASLGSSFGLFVSELYDMFAVMDMQSLLLRLIVPAAGLMVFMFGIFYVMNVFYFSRDVENYLYLPVKAGEIMSSKFLVSLVYEYFIMGLIFLPLLVVYGVKDSAGILFYVYSILVLLLVPVFPLVIASLFAMVIMRFSNKFKNRDRFNMVASVLSLFLALGLNFGMQYLTNVLSRGQTTVSDISQLLIFRVTALVFPTSHFATESLIAYDSLQGLLNLALVVLLTLAALLVFYAAGNALYFKGVIGVTESKADRKALSTSQMAKETSSRNILISYSLKEFKLLVRTPVYFLNCVLISLIYPLFFIIPFALGSSEDTAELEGMYQFIRDTDKGILLVVLVGAGFLLGSINIISSTAFSREGKNFYFIKYIPVSYMTQIYAKILSSFYVEALALVLFYSLLFVLFRISPVFLLFALILVLMASMLVNQLGILLDILWPKLNWDTEQKAVKQNLNSLFHMALGFGLTAITIFVGVKLNPNLYMAYVVSFLVLAVLILAMHFVLKNRVVHKFSRM